jgi:hypothetical protein
MPLADLRQLLRIAKQHQVAGRAGHRDGVGETELAGLLDHQQVEAVRVDAGVVSEIPCGAADYAAVVGGDERGVVVLVDVLPRGVLRRILLADPRRVDARLDQVAEQVLHHGV